MQRCDPNLLVQNGGNLTLINPTLTTAGNSSSTGNIAVSNATLHATGSEAAVIEGRNSITLTDCTLSAAVQCGVMIYQSFSGDAQGRKGTFTMEGGSLTASTGPLFHVKNTTGVIKLAGARVSAASGTLVNASTGRWGRSGFNGGHVILTTDGETLTGDLTCDGISSITATLQNGTTLTGSIKGAASALDSTSKWNVTEDSILSSLTDPTGLAGAALTNIVGNGHDVRYNASLPENKWLDGKTYTLANGGQPAPECIAATVTISTPVSTTSPQLGFSFSGGQMLLSWPLDHTGWTLEAQTNSLGIGRGTNWVAVPNSATANQISLPVNLTNGCVFFRLVYP